MKNNSRVAVSKRLTESSPTEGMRLITVPTNLEDAIIIHGSLPGGDISNPKDNPCISMLTLEMLDEGTATYSKKDIREKLESLGASIEFNSDTRRIGFALRCLKKDAPAVIDLLALELSEPTFPTKDLSVVKARIESQIDEELDDTKYRAETKFLQMLYPKTHLNYRHDGAALKKFISKTTRQNLVSFHKAIYGQADAIITAAGDIDLPLLSDAFAKAFAFAKSKKVEPEPTTARGLQTRTATEVISIRDKTSADLYIGAPIGITKNHHDYYPLLLGFSILGGTFFARLMHNVREKKGLTYRTRAGLGGTDHGLDGYWYAFAMFAPEQFIKGEEAVMLEIENIVTGGITAKELQTHKETIDGSFKVALASAQGMSAVLLDNAEEGRPHEFIDKYVSMINQITLDQVNAAIKKYICLDNIITVAAGSIDTDKSPLKG